MKKFLGFVYTVVPMLVTTWACSTAGAHEGHGQHSLNGANDAAHYLTEPLHLSQLCVAAAALFCVSVIALHGRHSRKSVAR